MNTEPTENRRRRTREETKKATKERLLEAARKEFAAKGFAGASLEAIAEEAGYTTGAVYHHFANKDELFLELIETGWSRQTSRRAEALRAVLASDSSRPFGALDDALEDQSRRGGESLLLAAEFWLYAARNIRATAMVAKNFREQGEEFEPLVAKMMTSTGTGSPLSPSEFTVVALTLFEGLTRRRRVDPTAFPSDLLSRALTMLLLRGSDGD